LKVGAKAMRTKGVSAAIVSGDGAACGAAIRSSPAEIRIG
jgi:hypothetical protein